MSKTVKLPAVEELAQRRLREADVRFSKCVTCEYRDGIVVLRGRLPTYHLKQIVQTIVAEVPDVQHVDNRIQVFATILG